MGLPILGTSLPPEIPTAVKKLRWLFGALFGGSDHREIYNQRETPFCVLQIHSLAHTALHIGRGQSNQFPGSGLNKPLPFLKDILQALLRGALCS